MRPKNQSEDRAATIILLVDDNRDSLRGTDRILKSAGYRVINAVDGLSAVRLSKELHPHLVLLDVVLPDITGLEVLRQIRNDPDLVSVSVVLLSAFKTEPADQVRGLDAGADGYIARPITSNELLARVRSQLRQRNLSEDLRFSEQRYRRLFESAKDGILILDAESGMVMDVNPFLVELLGYTHEQFLGKAIWELGFFADIVANSDRFIELKAKEYVRYANLPMKTASGRAISVEFVSNVYLVEGTKVIQCNIRDITEREKVERALEQSERSFRELIQHMHIALVSHGPDMRVLFSNPMASQLLGLTTDQMCGKPVTDAAWNFVRRDGSVMPVDEYPVNQALRDPEGEIRDLVLGITKGNRAHITWVQCNSHVLHGNGGETQQILVTFADITDLIRATSDLKRALEQTEIQVADRTAQLERANEDLLLSAERADAANSAKSEFLSRMSHELRTPLNSILGFGQVLQSQELTNLQAESVQFILTGGRHLLELINEVLDIARVDAGRIEISLQAVSIDQIVSETFAMLSPLAAADNIRLTSTATPNRPTHVMADVKRLKQILLNLITNAIKYNREGGMVDLYWSQQGLTSVVISIADTGFGIKPEDMEKLFVPFERIAFRNSNIEGTGLGLALSKRLVTAMGGKLNAKSTLGVGSVFSIELALAQVPNSMQTASDRNPFNGTRDHLRVYTILAIEDNLANLRLLEVILSLKPEFKLLAANRGGTGLEIARTQVVDIILLDLDLPDISGLQVLELLRGEQLTRSTPVVVVSADATPSQVVRMMQAGATAYITKPYDVQRLLETLEEHLPET